MSEDNQDMERVTEISCEVVQADLPSPGEKLKTIREELGLSYVRVAESLHMTVHYVKALEEGDYDKLPGETFIKGYFKAYARLLGVDPGYIMECYNQHFAALVESVENEESERRAQKVYDQNLRWMVCAAVIIIIVVALSWWFARDKESLVENADNDSGVLANISETAIDTVFEESGIQGPQSDNRVTAEALVASLADTESSADPVGQNNATLNSTSSSSGAGNEAVTQTIEEKVAQTSKPLPLPAQSSVVSADNVAELGESETKQMMEKNSSLSADQNTAYADEQLAPSRILPDYTVTRVNNSRKIELESEGDDLLVLSVRGESWIEIDNGENARLYHDMLNTGDELTIKGSAPFNILMGDARVVEMTFNANDINFNSRIRSDNSARVILPRENR